MTPPNTPKTDDPTPAVVVARLDDLRADPVTATSGLVGYAQVGVSGFIAALFPETGAHAVQLKGLSGYLAAGV